MTHVVRIPMTSPIIVGKHVRSRSGAGLSYQQGLREDVEEWMREQEITLSSLKMTPDCRFLEASFKSEVEAVAFRMRW